MNLEWYVDPQIASNYLNKCRLFAEDPTAFAHFKRDKDYQKILEGNEREVGDIAVNSLKEMGAWEWALENLALFKENEKLGDPELLSFDGLEVAASTLRYVNSVAEIRELLEEDRPKTVLEIGGGYGALCLLLSQLYDFDSYTLVDLPEANALCNRYLSYFPVYPKIRNITPAHVREEPCDLFIADSSLSECDMETQMIYAKAASQCKYIYLVYNVAHQDDTQKNLQRIIDTWKGMGIHLKKKWNVYIVRCKKSQ